MFVYLCICVFVFVYLHVRHLGTLFLRSSNNVLFKNIAHVRFICKFDPKCICVIVGHSRTLFLRSSYHYLFKNITHVRSIFKFDPNCICVFVYLCIFICVFGCQTPGNIVFGWVGSGRVGLGWFLLRLACAHPPCLLPQLCNCPRQLAGHHFYQRLIIFNS